ncbi:AP2-like ethylene-responsive transcription factor AIL6 [Tanacetum coccineum]|uniref:AP2-like ethylene-responsive transcription factor AIL6 n=1 Tax=Tanacetum coccineum TaxID=301880 RepID=A0ABQ5GDB1_9ASTR
MQPYPAAIFHQPPSGRMILDLRINRPFCRVCLIVVPFFFATTGQDIRDRLTGAADPLSRRNLSVAKRHGLSRNRTSDCIHPFTQATPNFLVANYAQKLQDMKKATKQEFIASLKRKSSGFSRGASIYRGVTRHHQQGRWQARIRRVARNKDLYLGTFATEEVAAEAYDIATIKFRGMNAMTNFEMNQYDVEAILAARFLFSGNTGNNISFGGGPPVYALPYDPNSTTRMYHHQSLFHHLHNTDEDNAPANTSSHEASSDLPGLKGETGHSIAKRNVKQSLFNELFQGQLKAGVDIVVMTRKRNSLLLLTRKPIKSRSLSTKVVVSSDVEKVVCIGVYVLSFSIHIAEVSIGCFEKSDIIAHLISFLSDSFPNELL